MTRGKGISWREHASERLWAWFRDRAGISDLATSAQIGATAREVGELADKVEDLTMMVADLRDQLNMEPLIKSAKDLDNYRIPSGDPMGL